MTDIASITILWQAYKIGDPLTDNDLQRLYKFVSQTEENLGLLGPEFHLAWKEVFYAKRNLEGFIKSRKENKKASSNPVTLDSGPIKVWAMREVENSEVPNCS